MQYCVEPGCAQLVTRGRCATHALRQEHARPNYAVREIPVTVCVYLVVSHLGGCFKARTFCVTSVADNVQRPSCAASVKAVRPRLTGTRRSTGPLSTTGTHEPCGPVMIDRFVLLCRQMGLPDPVREWISLRLEAECTRLLDQAKVAAAEVLYLYCQLTRKTCHLASQLLGGRQKCNSRPVSSRGGYAPCC